MKDNRIIEELRMLAELDWRNDVQGQYYNQRYQDARPVQITKMAEVFTPEQLTFLRQMGYSPKPKMCYLNASALMILINEEPKIFPGPARYVEGLVSAYILPPIDHAFILYGDKYIDPTFEMALRRDVYEEEYVALIELDFEKMMQYQLETGYYGELYQYDYFLRHYPEKAAKIRELNPIHRKIRELNPI